jgi:colanic acid/amylovoran biosynthesis protein
LLRELGVAGSRITVTGDDAIELAREGRGKEAGHGLGINVRIAAYAGLGPDETGQLRSVLQGIARELGAPLVPIPIARAGGAEDVASLSALLEGWNGGLAGALQLETPGDVAAQVSRCRLVITGSYHAAVFALAQGIPAVGLARSDYYASKFSGLAALFGEGCRSVALDGPAWPSQLEQVARSLWEAADTLRPDLSARASRQIELGLQTYGRLPALVADGAVAAR